MAAPRLYPEDIKQLFPTVPMGTRVEYIYEPAKIGFRMASLPVGTQRRLFQDPSMILHVLSMIEQRGLTDQVNMRKVLQTVEEQTGMPMDITRETEGAGGQISRPVSLTAAELYPDSRRGGSKAPLFLPTFASAVRAGEPSNVVSRVMEQGFFRGCR